MVYASTRQSYGARSGSMKTDAGKRFYRKTRTTSAGNAKAARAGKATTRRRANTTKTAKVFKVVVAKRRKR